VPAAILTKSRQVPVNAAKQSSHKAAASVSATRHVNTAAPRPNVNSARPKTTQDLQELHPKKFKRLFKDGRSRRIDSSTEEASLGEEDASKQGRKNDTNEEFDAADEEQKQ
nr:hypothetical protein [Tanacetum cinerariifolium]